MVWADTDCLSGFDDQGRICAVGTGWLGFVHKGSVQNGFHTGFGLGIFIREIFKCKYKSFIQINTGIQIIGDQFIRCGIPAVTIKGCPCVGFNVVTDRRGTPVVARITAGSLNQIFDLTGSSKPERQSVSAHTTLPPESNRRLAHHSVLPQTESIPYIRESIISITSAVSTA